MTQDSLGILIMHIDKLISCYNKVRSIVKGWSTIGQTLGVDQKSSFSNFLNILSVLG